MHADPAARLAVRRADGDLPGRAAADPGRAVRGGRGRRRRRVAAVLLGSRCRCCRRSSSSTWCCRSSSAFQAFTPAFVVSGGNGGPSDSTLFYTLYLYQQGFAQLPTWATPSAMAWVLLLDHRASSPRCNFRTSPLLGLLRRRGGADDVDRSTSPTRARRLAARRCCTSAAGRLVVMLYPLLWMVAALAQAERRDLRRASACCPRPPDARELRARLDGAERLRFGRLLRATRC